ncbi:MAG: SGNH/GDSL hydrolase family protein [Verrucomicrobiales bacterium]|nr:SGNH/GDSL hydrolase family protein [Verrucomicrobiales bacterium]
MPARRNLRAIAAGLTLLILGSAAWGVVSVQRQSYGDRWLRKAYPVVAPPFEIRAQAAGPDRTLLLLGDSRVADWGLPSIPGWRVVNAGVPGLTSSEMVLIASEALRQSEPHTVVIQAGINELKIIGVRKDLYEPLLSLCESNVLKVAHWAAERGAEVLIAPVWPTGPVPFQRSLVWSYRIPQAVEEVNLRLSRSASGQPRIRIFDAFKPAPSSASPMVPPLEPQLRDTLHFTPAFYEQLTQRLILELKP